MKMKKLVAVIIAALVLIMGCSSAKSSSSGINTGSSQKAKGKKMNELDKAIIELSSYLKNRIPVQSKVVFLNIKSDWPDLSDYILSALTENAVNDDAYTVVDRQQLDDIRKELNFQYSGEVSDASAQKIGEMMGAQTIVSGVITSIGSTYRIQVRAIDVQTAGLKGQFSQNVEGKLPIVASLTKRVVPAGSAQASAGTPRTQTVTQPAAPAVTTQAVPAQPAAPLYKIGDTGPAGGLIFYDKGNNSGGWRYLEAAPVEAEFRAAWTVRNTAIEGMQDIIGSGKRNTKLIVEKFKQSTGEWDTAAQKADDLVFNKFDDWFLPSKAELDQMYGNLKRKNLGDFKNDWYWSSTGGYVYDSSVYASSQNFKDGNFYSGYWGFIGTDGGENKRYVRPIRQF